MTTRNHSLFAVATITIMLLSAMTLGADEKTKTTAAAEKPPPKKDGLPSVDNFFLSQSNHSARSPNFQETYNVVCGLDAGFCPDDYPICCGTLYYPVTSLFCVTGGQKCCQSLYNPSQRTACGIDEECCTSNMDATCCDSHHRCQTGLCVLDLCSNTSDPQYCLSHKECSWCCPERKCQQKSASLSCGNNGEIISVEGQQCSDPCTYRARCDECMDPSQQDPASPCQWCCQTQSCMSNKSAQSRCDQWQLVTKATECPACGVDGKGLHIESGTAGPTFEMMAVTVGTVIIVALGGLFIRIAAARRIARQQELLRAILGEDADRPPPVVHHFGFEQQEEEADSEADERTALLPATAAAHSRDKQGRLSEGIPELRCGECGAQPLIQVLPESGTAVAVPLSEQKEEERTKEDDKEEEGTSSQPEGANKSYVSEELTDLIAGGRHEHEEESSAGTETKTAAAATEIAVAAAVAAPPKFESEDDGTALLVLLPCYHFICVNCMEKKMKRITESKKKAAAEKCRSSSARGQEQNLPKTKAQKRKAAEAAAAQQEAAASRPLEPPTLKDRVRILRETVKSAKEGVACPICQHQREDERGSQQRKGGKAAAPADQNAIQDLFLPSQLMR